MVLILAAFH